MSKIFTGILGVIALSVSFGAVQFAMGHDLTSGVQAGAGPAPTVINRAAKTDRAAIARSDRPTRTISLQLDGLSDTSVLVRVPVAQASGNGTSAPSLMKSATDKPAVACEPVVSVLTEVAKQLQPGRCVT